MVQLTIVIVMFHQQFNRCTYSRFLFLASDIKFSPNHPFQINEREQWQTGFTISLQSSHHPKRLKSLLEIKVGNVWNYCLWQLNWLNTLEKLNIVLFTMTIRSCLIILFRSSFKTWENMWLFSFTNKTWCGRRHVSCWVTWMGGE